MNYSYKGYRILRSDINWIEKAGAFICYANDRTHAMRMIDELVEH